MENKINFLVESLWITYDKIKNSNKYICNLFPIFKENNFKTKKELMEYIINNQQSLKTISNINLDLIATTYKEFIADANSYNNDIKKIINIQLETQKEQNEDLLIINNVLNPIEQKIDEIQYEETQSIDKMDITDTLTKIQNLYENNYENNTLLINNTKNIFNIIKSFYNKQDDMCKDNTDCYYIEKQEDIEFPKINVKDNIYFSTDHHGDLAAFMFSLLESGVAKFKSKNCPIVCFSMKDKKVIDDIDEYIKSNGIEYLLPIPNLEINSDFDGKFICGGDLIDRGKETDSCLCLMYHLLKQNGSENKIEYMVGNHEDMVIRNYYEYYNDVSNNVDLAKNMLVELANEGKMKFASCSEQTIFSHTVFEKDCIMSALNLILNDENKQLYYSEKYNAIFNKTLNIQEIENLRDNIYYGFEELNKENIELLTELLNLIFVENIKSIEDKPEEQKIDEIFTVNSGRDIKNHKGLLWTRELDSSKQIKGLHQVVGHTPQTKFKPTLENGIIRADTIQSNGYNVNFSNATLLHFKYGQCQIKIKDINKDLINEKSVNEYQTPSGALNTNEISIYSDYVGKSLIYLLDNDLIKDSDFAEFYENIIVKENKMLREGETIYDVLVDYSIALLTRQSENNINIKELFDNIAIVYDINETDKQMYFETFNKIIEYHNIQKANEEYYLERDTSKFIN